MPKGYSKLTGKLILGRLGKHNSEEHKRKAVETRIKKGSYIFLNKGIHHSDETKKKISLAKIGKLRPDISILRKGIAISEYTKRKMSEAHKGEKHPNWKGGITPVNQQIRGSLEYKLWSDSVWNKDNNCCQKCGESRIRNLVAHHILNFSNHIELRFAIDNGITLCRNCHKLFHKVYGKKNNSKEQIKKFIN